ncbi:conserved uncharacterized protein [Desulfococcus multivorans]|jgi:hypothetical protein|nr:conserved uncharacterized protein [Desulfococcus multivorans]
MQKEKMTADRLSELEAIIDRNRRSFYVIGKALYEIRENRLYRLLGFKTFEAYVKDRWSMGKSHAHRFIEAYRVIENLSPIGDILPENESQVRPLVPLTPLEQRNIWRQFLASGMALTAKNICRLVSDAGRTADPANRTSIISDDYRQAVMAMLEQVRLAQNDQWQSTSRQAALLWNRVIRDKILYKISKSEKP